MASEFDRVPLSQVRYAHVVNELANVSTIAAAAPGPQSRQELDFHNKFGISATAVMAHSSQTYSL